MANGVKILLDEWLMDGDFTRFALVATIPLLFAVSMVSGTFAQFRQELLNCVSQFFCLTIVTNVIMAVGPVAQYHENSKYYSGVRPKANSEVDRHLPHITIQMPVYKESLRETMYESVSSELMSLTKALN